MALCIHTVILDRSIDSRLSDRSRRDRVRRGGARLPDVPYSANINCGRLKSKGVCVWDEARLCRLLLAPKSLSTGTRGTRVLEHLTTRGAARLLRRRRSGLRAKASPSLFLTPH